MDVFQAARSGDVVAVRAAVAAGCDVAAIDERGWTALHHGALCAERDPGAAAEVLSALLDAGAPTEKRSGDGRTALYLAAEFCRWPEPVELLLAHGAAADVTNGQGVHVTANAWSPDVATLLRTAMGGAVSSAVRPAESRDIDAAEDAAEGPDVRLDVDDDDDVGSAPPVDAPPVTQRSRRRLSRSQWGGVRKRVDLALYELDRAGFVALPDIGTTQEEGFDICVETVAARGGELDGLVGFCFYTRQDMRHGRATGWLPLAFWGAPAGGTVQTEHAGEVLVEAFRQSGFDVVWDGTATNRPYLHLTD